MASSPPSSPPLVWVTQGKSQHAAYLLEPRESDNSCLIKWNSTNEVTRVPQSAVARALTPRRRRRLIIEEQSSEDEEHENQFMRVDEIQTQENGKRKASPRDVRQNDDDESDEEVQVLLTVLPPTPKRPKQKRENVSQTNVLTTEARRVSTSPQPNKETGVASLRNDEGSCAFGEEFKQAVPPSESVDSVNKKDSKPVSKNTGARCVSTSPQLNRVTEPALRNDESVVLCDEENQAAVPVTDSYVQPSDSVDIQDLKSDTERTITFESCAYVQNLAEICYTIMNDARWRVEGQLQRRLFAWEQGEDLSAVHTLCNLFKPPKRKRGSKCCCLLCREEGGQESGIANTEDTSDEGSSPEHRETSSSDQSSKPDVGEQTARSLYLYCRLYHRKGPWFRLDNIYKYYAPEIAVASHGEDTESDTEEQENYDAILKERRNTFFERSSSSQFKTSSNHDNKKDGMIDQNLLEERLSEVALMLRDVDHLHDIGLIRSFRDEEECGKAVGAVPPSGYGFLTAGERRDIVDKLGGCGKSEKKPGTTSTEGKQVASSDNIIWKQMCQQKSISFAPSTKGKKDLLPVCRHVDDALLEKLATKVVYASSQLDYIPSAIRKPAVVSVKARILGMQRCGSKSLSMCLRLREAPLLTLRRCARLFLCATSGPGDMRGDDTNAWRSLKDLDATLIPADVPLPTVVLPPGSYSWHRVLHPGQHHRFGITSCAFIDAHDFVYCRNDDSDDEILGTNPSMSRDVLKPAQSGQPTPRAVKAQVFDAVNAFRLWEVCVEVRAHVDYHLELADMLAWRARRRRDAEEDIEDEEPSNEDGTEEDSDDDTDTPCISLTSECKSSLDFLDLLTVKGRKSMISKMVVLSAASCVGVEVDDVCEKAEYTLSNLEVFKGGTSSVGKLLQYDSERIAVILSVIILHVLIMRNQSVTSEELASKQARPWLRHLWWEGILAYALWDCIPLLERKGFYELACSCLEVVLFGKIQKRHSTLSLDETATGDQLFDIKTTLSEILMSRRVRGKAHERLVIDYKHVLQWKAKTGSAFRGARTKKTEEKKANDVSPQDAVSRVCGRVVGVVARAGSIPFSAVRSLARKMKRPLAKSLETVSCMEVESLGIRLDNGHGVLSKEDATNQEPKEVYFDWVPPTDFAVANAMAGEETLVGKRCSYVGFEDNTAEKADTSSLNVEELAMQYYATGRLPVAKPGNEKLLGGGWVGWHDEGGHVRALFRIICAHAILGMDSGCGKESASALESLERLTIHLTPYQGAPFDLHVAHWESSSLAFDKVTADEAQDDKPVRSFYHRRRIQIERFLGKLESLSDQELSDLVYDSVICRLGQGRLQDTLLARDVQQLRTLSMLAAGFGGKQLSAMFRCLLFDYRHYSGGLPDLLLVRAISAGDADAEADGAYQKSLVDLGKWVGEEFSAQSKSEKEAKACTNLLIDKDDEYLGCSKLGDSGGQSSSHRRQGTQRKQSRNEDEDERKPDEVCLNNLPPKLALRHNDQDVQVQCLFVEVKSQNDRLDGRQEDWLNVLDRVGNARVCKFGRGKKKSSKKAAAKSKRNAKLD